MCKFWHAQKSLVPGALTHAKTRRHLPNTAYPCCILARMVVGVGASYIGAARGHLPYMVLRCMNTNSAFEEIIDAENYLARFRGPVGRLKASDFFAQLTETEGMFGTTGTDILKSSPQDHSSISTCLRTHCICLHYTLCFRVKGVQTQAAGGTDN